MVLLVILAAQLFGAGDVLDSADADLDFDADPGAVGGGFLDATLSLLGIGRVPVLIWFALLLLVFTIAGLGIQAGADALLGGPLAAVLAALVTAAIAVPLTGFLARPLAGILPQDETSAVSLDGLVRRDAVIQIGTAKAGSPARSKVLDAFGHPHFVMVEPNDEDAALGEGETVLLVRREGERFFAVRYESPLLGLK